MEGTLVRIGPIPDPGVIPDLSDALERAGLPCFDDFFEMTGNWHRGSPCA